MSTLLVILGNGPSLKGFDFKKLEKFDTIGMNAAYRHWYEIGWFPRYYICLDKIVGVSHKDQIARLIRESDSNGIELFLLRRNLIELFDESLQKSDRVLDFDTMRASIDLFDPLPFTTGSHAALFGALMGYRELLLLGIDCNYVEKVAGAKLQDGILEIVETSNKNPNYFFDGYQAAGDRYNIPNPAPNMHIESWRAVASTLKQHGIAVWNGSSISRLTEFPFRTFDDIEATSGKTPRAVPSLPIFTRFDASAATDQVEGDGEQGSPSIVNGGSSAVGRMLSSIRVRVANWAQQHNAPSVLYLGRFGMWCLDVARRNVKISGLAGLSILALLLGGAVSANLRAPLWLAASAALLAITTIAAFAFMRAELLRRANTLDLALTFAKRREATRARDAAPDAPQSFRHGSTGAASDIAASVECVWPARAVLGEGCCWDRRSQKVYWTDIKGKRLHAWSVVDGTRETWDLPFRIGSIGIPPHGWEAPSMLSGDILVGAGDLGLMWIGLEGGRADTVAIVHPEEHLPDNRFNDGKFGPDGRYWAGTMHDPETSVTGSLYAFAPDGGYAVMDSGYRVPNGPAFSPDGTILYHTDSALRTIYAFGLTRDGQLADRRVLVSFAENEGSPDGMTVDRSGNVWVAMWDGFRIEKITPDGTRVGSVRLPTPRPTSCSFAGDDDNVMFVTTAAIGVGEEDAFAGGLFRLALRA